MCKGTGEIDTDIHIVETGQLVAKCGKSRPATRRRRTTDPQKATCETCLALCVQEASNKRVA